uniref:hybrid non-ribosomal peptide synthetase/type I polyketide synthase n=2 Tax=Paenibacillus polymyxa TaxID=1406 RepID=UPI001D017DBA|nr:non-ribosomal peptide synthetase [Paenibacillus polymyxa]
MMTKTGFNLAALQFNEQDFQDAGPIAVNELRDSDIAVIGISCKIAESENVAQFWDLLRAGQDAIRPFPARRKRELESLFQAGLLNEQTALNEGGFLEEIDKFDYPFFQLSPAEARLMDPSQRLFLESAWAAVEDAGYGGKMLSGSRTGVYVGYSSDFGEEYKRFIAEMAPSSASSAIPGNIHSMIASRIAYLLDLKGPSLLVDTACSSSLVAIHLACRDLRHGDCDTAIAGGVKVTLVPIKEGKGGGLGVGSSDDRTRTFDSVSDGTGGGEGVAAVLLKPLKRAIQDQDHIYAVIKGSAVNNDGTSAGITAPNSLAGEDVIVRAWKDAGIDPDTITYIEAHGTGTKLGDPVEIDGIRRAFRQYTDRNQFCAIGSVKTNVGHLDNSAGITGFLKAVLALEHAEIPASLHFTCPNPDISFIDSPVYVNDKLQPWPKEDFPRRCGVSSFGLSGTNCHVVLEEAPVWAEMQDGGQLEQETPETVQLFTLSAKNETVLAAYVKQYQQYVMEPKTYPLRDLCYTANTGRGQYGFRLAILCRDWDDLGAKLTQIQTSGFSGQAKQEEFIPGVYFGCHKVVSAQKEKEAGELTLEESRRLTASAKEKLTQSSFEFDTLDSLCRMYVEGADVEWESLYEGKACRRRSLPTYPFEPKRCWVEVEEKAVVSQASHVRKFTEMETTHPLLDYCLAETEDQDIYLTRFSVGRHWVLSEHKIMENCIVPGTTYLEMVRAGLEKYKRPGKVLELYDIQFISPLIVDAEEEREVHTVLQREGETFSFKVLSRTGPSVQPWEQNWVRHAQGRAVFVKAAHPVMSLGDIRTECNDQEVVVGENHAEAAPAFSFGPRWETLRTIAIGTDQVLAKLELPAAYHMDVSQYVLHPALLDVAVGVASQSLGNGLFLPFSYHKLRIYDSLPRLCYSYLRKKNKVRESGEILTVDVLILGAEGQVLVEIEDYAVKRVHEADLKRTRYTEHHKYHQIVWKKQEQAPSEYEEDTVTRTANDSVLSTPLETVLLFTDNRPIGVTLRGLLAHEGYDVVEVKRGVTFTKMSAHAYFSTGSEEDHRRLLTEMQCQNAKKLIYLWNGQSMVQLFHLAKAIAETKSAVKELTVIAEQAYKVNELENELKPEHAGLFGLARVIGQEYPDLSCRCLDIDTSTQPSGLIHSLRHDDDTFLVAWRNGERYVEQIEPVDLTESEVDPITIRPQGTYVITGGTGGLGLAIGKWLASKGQVTLGLIGRKPLPPKEQWEAIANADSNGSPKNIRQNSNPDMNTRMQNTVTALLELEQQGAQVEYYAVDVADETAMKQALNELRHKYGAIHGIIHAAGVAGDGFMALKSQDRFTEVLAPKVTGTHVLDRITTADTLDFFILFSSVTSLMGGPGQSDYTAANAYLDAFAEWRNHSGRRTLAINWAPWQEVGMAFEHEVDFQESLFQALSTQEGLAALEQLLLHPVPRVIVGGLNYAQVAALDSAAIPFGFSHEMRAILDRHRRLLHDHAVTSSAAVRRPVQLRGRATEQYSSSEKVIASIWAEVLGLDELNIYDSFYELGGDSLIASKMVGQMNQSLSKKVDMSDIFNYMTVSELALYTDGEAKQPLLTETELPAPQSADKNLIIHPVEQREVYPASSTQRRFYMMRQMAGYSTLNNLCSAMTITGNLDHHRLEKAIYAVIRRHSSLRTAFELRDNELVQRVYPEVDFSLEYSEGDGRELEAYVDEFIRPFDLNRAPLLKAKLIRLKDDSHLFLCDVDHIAADGASIGILLSEMIQGYSGQDLPQLPMQYTDFTLWQNQRLDSAEMKKQEAYWLDVFKGTLPVLDLPTDEPRAAQMSNAGDVYTFDLSEELTALAKKTAVQHGVTLFMLLYAVYSTLLAKYANQEEIIIGIPSAGRQSEEVQHMIGLFINTLALRTAPAEDKPFAAYLQEVKKHALEAYKHEDYPFEMLLNQLDVPRDRSRNPLFDVQFISQNFRGEPMSINGLRFTPLEAKMEAVQVDLTVIWVENEGKLRFHFEYATQLFKGETIRRLASYYKNLLQEVCADASRPIGLISMNQAEEQQRTLYEWNETRVNYPQEKLVHQWFEEQAEQHPERIAAVYGEHSLTYSQLNIRANQLARHLLTYHLVPDQAVGILVPRSLDMLTSMLAVLKVGAAYVPMDPEHPTERVAYMLEDSGVSLLLTSTDTVSIDTLRFTGSVMDVSDPALYSVDADNLAFAFAGKESLASHHLAYILYTSGSSGKPKGVMVEHRNVTNYITAFQHEFHLTAEDVVLQQAAITFDASVEEIYPTLAAGGTLAMVSRDELKDIQLLNQFIRQQQVTVVSASPFILNELNQLPPFPHIRTYISGGDVLKSEYVTQLLRSAKVYNTYGPTEATVCATYYCVPDIPAVHPLPVGRPVANAEVYIMNRRGTDVMPIGVPGEICISGWGVARGYMNRPELTQQQFVANPWIPGERMYKTGDLGRYLEDGQIQFLGRVDQQVKVRGYRIEPGEVEKSLLQHPRIQDGVVLVQEVQPGMHELCAYIVTDQELSVAELKTHLSVTLPEYMIPSYFVRVDEIPLTHHGKIDRHALPQVNESIKVGTAYVHPASPLEERLVELWSEILHREQIGTQDDFFLLGGQSLLATKLVYLINKEWNVNLTLRDFFRAGTVQGLATWIEEIQSGRERGILVEQDGLIKPFNLRQKPLFRVQVIHQPANRHLLFIDMHHIITDGLSQEIIVEEFARLYGGMSLPELTIQYKDYAVWQREFLNSVEFRQQEQFWLELFQGEITELELPTDYARPDVRRGEGQAVHFELDQEWTWKLKRFALQQNVTVFMVLLAAYNLLLAKASGQEDIIVGIPVSGRTHASLSPLVGMFVNTLALRNTPEKDMTVHEFLMQVKERSFQAFEHQDYPFEQLIEKLNLAGKTSRNPLFDTMFALLNESSRTIVELPGLKLTPCDEAEYTGAQFDLTFTAAMTDEHIECILQYDVDLFTGETVERLGREYLQILHTVLVNSQQKIGELRIEKVAVDPNQRDREEVLESASVHKEEDWVSELAIAASESVNEAEWKTLVHDFNQTDMDPGSVKLLHQYFEDQASRNPEQIALISGQQEISYGEVNRRANLVAHSLLDSGTRLEQIVAIVMERSPEMIVALLGVLKAGAAYLPIHPADPKERIRYILADAGAEWILTHQQCHASWMDEEIQQIMDVDLLCQDQQERGNPELVIQPDHLAYVIFTSGSTGQPKGVMVEHHAFSARVVWLAQQLGLREQDTVLQKASYTFDGSIVELFSWFMGGGRLVLLEAGAETDTRQMLDTIHRHQVTVAFFIPTVLQMFLSELSVEDTIQAATLRWVMSGGEQIGQEQVRSFNLKFPEARLLNLYGPTEASVFATAYTCTSVSSEGPIPIGRPVGNTRAYILNQELALVGLGQVGELCLGGCHLARGYVHLDGLTAERFIPNPFVPGERIYRTGDLARMLPSGEIVYLGRSDQMVKIGGYRIEIGEIETALLQNNDIQQAAVLDLTDEQGNKYLCAYLVVQTDCTVRELRAFLLERLPEYMIPLRFVKVETMPLGSSGKLDRKALNTLGVELPSGKEHTPPRNEMEQQLLLLWADIFKTGAVGIDDHFFEFGGDSLLAYQFILRVRQMLAIEITLKELFAAPTIRQLSDHISSRRVECHHEDEATVRSLIPAATPSAHYPASSAQMRLFMMHELNPEDLSYNLPGAMMLEGELDLARLEGAFQALIQRHEAFRTTFDVINGEIVQLIHESVPFAIEFFRTEETEISNILRGDGKLMREVIPVQQHALSSVKVEKKERRRREI